MKKKVKLIGLKSGTKFRYKRMLWIKDNEECYVKLSDGTAKYIGGSELVTPIKIKISEVK